MPHEHLGLGEHPAGGRARARCSTRCSCCRTSSTRDTFTELDDRHGIIGVTQRRRHALPAHLVVTPGPALRVKLEYRPDVVDAAPPRRLLDRLHHGARRGCAGRPGAPVGAAATCCCPTSARRCRRMGATEHAVPDDTVADLLAEQAARTPRRDRRSCSAARR